MVAVCVGKYSEVANWGYEYALTEQRRERVSGRQSAVAELSWRLDVSELDGAARQHEPRLGARAGCQDLDLLLSPLNSDMGN
jgi:hypothetical protein